MVSAGEDPPARGKLAALPGCQLSRLQHARMIIWLTLEDPGSSPIAQLISFGVLITIFTSIVNFSVGSVANCQWSCASAGEVAIAMSDSEHPNGCAFSAGATRTCSPSRVEDSAASQLVELVCIIIFTAEYVLRVLTCTTAMPLCTFFLAPMNLIDLIAILPWYIIAILTATLGSESDNLKKIFGVVRVVRLTRVLRVFRVSKSMKMMVVLFRTLERSRQTLLILFCSVFTMMLLFGALVMQTERGTYNPHVRQYLLADGEQSAFLGIPDAMYWCMATMTTVGYGDLYPESPGGYVIGIITQLAGTVILSLPITVIGATFSEEYMEQQRIAERERRLNTRNNLNAAANFARSDMIQRKFGGNLLGMARRRRMRPLRNATSPQVAPAAAAKQAAGATAAAAATSSSSSTGSGGAARPGLLSRMKSSTKDMSAALASSASATGKAALASMAPLAGTGSDPLPVDPDPPIPGCDECEWLLDDFRSSTLNDVNAMLAKAEADLMRMTRKVIIHSRVLSQSNRTSEQGPDAGARASQFDANYPVPNADVPPISAAAELPSCRSRRA
jgi:hypothetical protein